MDESAKLRPKKAEPLQRGRRSMAAVITRDLLHQALRRALQRGRRSMAAVIWRLGVGVPLTVTVLQRGRRSMAAVM